MMNFNNINNPAPIFQGNQTSSTNTNNPNIPNSVNSNSSDPFDKLLNKSLFQKNQTISQEQKLEDYKKQIEQLDLDQLKIERKRLVDQIVKYMNEGKTELLEETQKKYKIAMQVSDSKVMNFSASAMASEKKSEPIAKVEQSEDFLKKLQETDVLPPDNTPAPIISQQISTSQKTDLINTTESQINSANPNVQMLSIPQSLNPQGIFNSSNPSIINTLNSMNANQINSLFSNPQGMFNSLNTLNSMNANPTNPANTNPFFSNSFSNILMNANLPVGQYSPLMTSYGVYAPNLRKDPTMDAFLNGQLYPTDMSELGVWSVLNREIFRKNED